MIAEKPRNLFAVSLLPAALCMVQLLSAAGRCDSVPVVGSVIVDGCGESSRLKQMVLDAAGIVPGSAFTAQQRSYAQENLNLCGQFAQAYLDTTVMDSVVTVRLVVIPARFVRDIRVIGSYPLFASEILGAMTLHAGDQLDTTRLEEQQRLVEEYLRREGFLEPSVRIRAFPLRTGSGTEVIVQVTPGHPWKTREVTVTGSRGIPPLFLAVRTRTWRSRLLPFLPARFIEQDLRSDVDKLTRFYRQRGFAEATIKPRVVRDTAVRSVDITLHVDEGAQYDISVSGIKGPLQRRRHGVQQPFVEQGNRNGRAVRAATRNIGDMLKLRGYITPHIELHDTADSSVVPPRRVLDFSVQKGSRARVSFVRIEGAERLSAKELHRRILTRPHRFFIEKTAREDALALSGYCTGQGYLNPDVTVKPVFSPDSTTVGIVFTLSTGPRTLVSSVDINGVTSLNNNRLHSSLATQVGTPFQPSLVRQDERRLSELISDKGYPFVTVTSRSELSADSLEARVDLTVTEGTRAVMGRVHFNGNFRTRSFVIQRELVQKTGDPFSLRDLLEGQRNLRNMDIFNSVAFRAFGLREKQDSIHLFLNLEEKRSRYLETAGGFESDSRAFTKFTYGNTNLLGTNRKAWVTGESGNLDRWIPELARGNRKFVDARGELGILEHRLFGSHTAATLDGYGERRARQTQEFGYTSYGSHLTMSRDRGKRVKISVGITYEWRQPFRINSTILNTDSTAPGEPARNLVRFAPTFVYDGRDSFIRPRKGSYGSFSIDIHKGLASRLDDFVLYRLELKQFWTPAERLTVAMRGSAGYLDPYGGQTALPSTQLLYLGGTRSVRGFNEDLLWNSPSSDSSGNTRIIGRGGNAALSASAELRWSLGDNFEITTFVDGGRVLSRYPDTNRHSSAFRTAGGVGLGYHTPIGPITIMYALKFGRHPNESPGAFHFSLGYPF